MFWLRDKTVLITGGTGSFGQRCAQVLLEQASLKRLILLSRDEHRMVAAERQFYVGLSYNSLQITYMALPVPAGSVLFYTNRTSTDQVTGFGRSVRHAIGRGMMEAEVKAFLDQLRRTAPGKSVAP